MNFFENVKIGVSKFTSYIIEKNISTDTLYLATGPVDYASQEKTESVLKNCFDKLTLEQKGSVYGKVWELAKMKDPRVEGEKWGEENAFKEDNRLAQALHRLGFLGKTDLHPLQCLPFGFGEGGLGSQYFSLGEKLGRDPETGQIGCVNGMGMPSLKHAGTDASVFSEKFADGNNIHCVYLSTHQKSSSGDTGGFKQDVLRMLAVNGGSYTRTSYLIVQQWIDFLDANPTKKYLQVGVSEGGAHVNAAVRLLKQARPDLLGRIRVMNFCPAYFVLPHEYSSELQAVNFIKKEDGVVNPWGMNTHQIGSSDHIVIVPHTQDNPHNHLNEDFEKVAKPYVFEFMKSGNLY